LVARWAQRSVPHLQTAGGLTDVMAEVRALRAARQPPP